MTVTVVDSDILLDIVKDKNKRRRFRNRVYNKELGFIYTTTDIIQKTLRFLRKPNEIKTLFEILKDFRIRAIDLHIFTDAYKLFEKYHEDLEGLDLVDWTTMVFIRDIEKALEEVMLLSRNSKFDKLKDYKNEAIIPIKRIEL